MKIKALLSLKALNLQLKNVLRSEESGRAALFPAHVLPLTSKMDFSRRPHSSLQNERGKTMLIHEKTCSTSCSPIQTFPLCFDRLGRVPSNCVLSCGRCNPVRNPLISGVKWGFASISLYHAAESQKSRRIL